MSIRSKRLQNVLSLFPKKLTIQFVISFYTKESILEKLGNDFIEEIKETVEDIYVKFFDDDDRELLKISDSKRIKCYSKCKDKLKMIKTGFKNLDESKKTGLGGRIIKLYQLKDSY